MASRVLISFIHFKHMILTNYAFFEVAIKIKTKKLIKVAKPLRNHFITILNTLILQANMTIAVKWKGANTFQIRFRGDCYPVIYQKIYLLIYI